MNQEELKLLRKTIDDLKDGSLTVKEKVLFVLGIQCGLYSDQEYIKDALDEIAEYCLSTEVEYKNVKDFDN